MAVQSRFRAREDGRASQDLSAPDAECAMLRLAASEASSRSRSASTSRASGPTQDRQRLWAHATRTMSAARLWVLVSFEVWNLYYKALTGSYRRRSSHEAPFTFAQPLTPSGFVGHSPA